MLTGLRMFRECGSDRNCLGQALGLVHRQMEKLWLLLGEVAMACAGSACRSSERRLNPDYSAVGRHCRLIFLRWEANKQQHAAG